VTAQYPPTLSIDGEPIAGTVLGDGLLPLADIEITWGQADLYAPTAPAVAKVAVLDETGAWSTDNALVGSKLVLTRAPGVVVFRGTIGDVSIDDYAVQDEAGAVHRVYRTTISATCPLADLDMAVVPGPGVPGSAPQTFLYGDDHWPRNSLVNWRNALLAGGAQGGVLRHVDDMAAVSNTIAGVGTGLLGRRYLASEGRSLLELVERLYAAYALSHVVYNPATHKLEIGLPAASAGLALVLDAGVIKLSIAAGYMVRAAQVIVEKQAVIRSTVLNAIDAVLVRSEFPNSSTGGPDANGNYFEINTLPGGNSTTHPQQAIARTEGARADKTLALDTTVYSPTSAPTVLADLAAQIAALVSGVNNQFAMPPVTFDFRRFTTGDPALDNLLLDTKSAPTAIYFLGSRFNHLANIGPQFQLIGGVLRWHPQLTGSLLDAGWTQEARLAPTVGVIDNVTIDNLVTNAGPTIEDFDPDITLADLGVISIGLA
jgi:hypothetical protein